MHNLPSREWDSEAPEHDLGLSLWSKKPKMTAAALCLGTAKTKLAPQIPSKSLLS